MASAAEKQHGKIQRLVDRLAKEQAKLILAEREEKRKQARADAAARAKQRAEDAHRKIGLGGLVIAAGADGWDPAEVVGALLVVGEKLGASPGLREQLRRRGIEHLQEREAARRKGTP